MMKPKTRTDISRSLDADWPPRHPATLTDLVAEELWCMGCNHHAASATGSASARRTATRNSPPWA